MRKLIFTKTTISQYSNDNGEMEVLLAEITRIPGGDLVVCSAATGKPKKVFVYWEDVLRWARKKRDWSKF